MKFIHIADIHLGAKPDAGSANSTKRKDEIWTSLEHVVNICKKENADLLLIAGDLFHRQPLLRELKELQSLFDGLEHTQVVMMAGNHDYMKKDSYYRTFPFGSHVHMMPPGRLACMEFPGIETAVYGTSYEQREMTEPLYDSANSKKRQKYEILLAHGGDDTHIPFQKARMEKLGYDYIACGHIHKPQILIPGKMAYAGALEPIDKNDTGAHGYILGTITDRGCQIQFVPCACREYVHIDIKVDRDTTGFLLKGRIKEEIENTGIRHIYKLTLKGYRAPDVLFDRDSMDVYGNIIEIRDETKPAYNFQKLKEANQDNLIGRFIESFAGCEEDSVEYQALCEGVSALMETKRG